MFAPTLSESTPFSRLWLVSIVGRSLWVDQAGFMFTKFYIEALLVNEDLANQLWELLESGHIDTDAAIFEWTMIPIREVSKAAD